MIFPCFNEELVLPESSKIIFSYFENLISNGQISKNSRICFIDDGSTDKTWEIIESFNKNYIIGIKLSRNFGHQNALLAGLETFKDKFDIYITMDVDLQDDIYVIENMIQKAKEGKDIIYGVRKDRSSDTFFKRFTAEIFYKMFSKMGVNIINNHADFRLINNKALNFFLKYKETHLFLRAIFPSIGLNYDLVYYKRKKREKGTSKYPLKKMISFAWNGITSFSATPLKLVLYIGLITILISFILLVWASIQLIKGHTITGWYSTITLIIFFGGVQTFAIGIIGEYIGKIFIQTKSRPRYLIEKLTNHD